MRLNAYLEIRSAEGGKRVIQCNQCDFELGTADQNYKKYAKAASRPISVLGVEYEDEARKDNPFELRQYFCPSCYTLLDSEVALRNDPVLHDAELAEQSSGGSAE